MEHDKRPFACCLIAAHKSATTFTYGPNDRSIDLYRNKAADYDASAQFTMQRAIAGTIAARGTYSDRSNRVRAWPWLASSTFHGGRGRSTCFVWLKNRPYNARAGDLWAPWSHVAERCNGFSWHNTQWGMGYIATGTLRGDPGD
jgi:hypothetical protein